MSGVSIWATGIGILVAVCGFAFWKGDKAERFGSVLIFGANLLADVLWLVSYPIYPTLPEFGIDFGLAAMLLLVALRYSSLWLGGAMLLQSMALFTHALTLGGDGPSAYTQVWINDIVSNAMLLCVVAGTIMTWLRRRRGTIIPGAKSNATAALQGTRPCRCRGQKGRSRRSADVPFSIDSGPA